MRYVFTMLLLVALSPLFGQDRVYTPERALKKLMKGNDRYAHDQMSHPRNDTIRRESTKSKQEPFAVIVTCSDSRVPPEILFDQGVGDLFIVRVAGNVVGPLELDSIDYAVLVLNAPLIFVLGHENCGAVDAVLQGNTKNIPAVAALIQPAVSEANKDGGSLEKAVKANVCNVIEKLERSPVISRLISENKVQVYGGYYNLGTGVVSPLPCPTEE